MTFLLHVLLQIGKFYEALGIDALVLMEYCGLNRMGASGTPEAGLPIDSLHRYLPQLTAAGFTVVGVHPKKLLLP